MHWSDSRPCARCDKMLPQEPEGFCPKCGSDLCEDCRGSTCSLCEDILLVVLQGGDLLPHLGKLMQCATRREALYYARSLAGCCTSREEFTLLCGPEFVTVFLMEPISKLTPSAWKELRFRATRILVKKWMQSEE